MTAPSEVIPCRWEHRRGEGRDAIFRAHCGRLGCKGVLGELRYQDSPAARVASSLSDRARGIEVLGVLEEQRRLPRGVTDSKASELAALKNWAQEALLATDGEWLMFANLRRTRPDHSGKFHLGSAYYYGYPDTGYHWSDGQKRVADGVATSRRPMQGPAQDMRVPGISVNFIEGQHPLPTDRIWCKWCRTLNQLDWPEPLRDRRSR